MKLDFKEWLDLQEKASFPHMFYPANKSGLRDVRFGYSLNKSETPPFHKRVGSDIISGAGDIWRQRMGTAFPKFGTGYRNYFDDSASYNDGNRFYLVKTVSWNRSDDPDEEKLEELTDSNLEKFKNDPVKLEKAKEANVDIIHKRPEITYHETDKEGIIEIWYMWKSGEEKSSIKLQTLPPANPPPTP